MPGQGTNPIAFPHSQNPCRACRGHRCYVEVVGLSETVAEARRGDSPETAPLPALSLVRGASRRLEGIGWNPPGRAFSWGKPGW